MKEKLGIVIHRYGREINGGAEDHCRAIAELMQSDYDVYIITSCSGGTNYYDNRYDEGITEDGNIHILRFATEKSFVKLDDTIKQIGPYCPSCIEYLKEHGEEYAAIIFMTYTNWLSYAGLSLGLKNAVFLPTAHEEEAIHDPIVIREFINTKAFLFNSMEEREMVYRLFHVSDIPQRTTCFGIDLDDYETACDKAWNSVPYILYAGRVSYSKNFNELNEFFLEYKKIYPSALKMVVIGAVDNNMPIIHHESIELKGFVDEKEKKMLMRGALCTVIPSEHESLSIVLLESFASGRPVLVKGIDVLKGQCRRSGGGLYYSDFSEFVEGLHYLEKNPQNAKEMGHNGYEYVKKYYSWELVKNNIDDMIAAVNKRRPSHITNSEEVIFDNNAISEVQIVVENQAREMGHLPQKPSDKVLKWMSRYKDVELVIVGAGARGQKLLKRFIALGYHNVVAFADNSPNKNNGDVLGIPIYSIMDAKKIYPNSYYIISPQFHYKELFQQLLETGIDIDRIDFYY